MSGSPADRWMFAPRPLTNASETAIPRKMHQMKRFGFFKGSDNEKNQNLLILFMPKARETVFLFCRPGVKRRREIRMNTVIIETIVSVLANLAQKMEE